MLVRRSFRSCCEAVSYHPSPDPITKTSTGVLGVDDMLGKSRFDGRRLRARNLQHTHLYSTCGPLFCLIFKSHSNSATIPDTSELRARPGSFTLMAYRRLNMSILKRVARCADDSTNIMSCALAMSEKTHQSRELSTPKQSSPVISDGIGDF